VYDLQKEAQQEAARLMADVSVPNEQRQQALAAMQNDIERSLNELLGPEAFNKLKQSGGALWKPPRIRQKVVPPVTP